MEGFTPPSSMNERSHKEQSPGGPTPGLFIAAHWRIKFRTDAHHL
jgi:hypothetical protein